MCDYEYGSLTFSLYSFKYSIIFRYSVLCYFKHCLMMVNIFHEMRILCTETDDFASAVKSSGYFSLLNGERVLWIIKF